MATMNPVLKGSRALFVLSLLMVTSACGANQVTGGAASSPPPSTSANQQPSTGTTPAPAQRTISGVIIEGIRSSCRVLQTDQRRYALTGAASKRLRPGDKVTITGVERSDLINPCGLTFVVVRIT